MKYKIKYVICMIAFLAGLLLPVQPVAASSSAIGEVQEFNNLSGNAKYLGSAYRDNYSLDIAEVELSDGIGEYLAGKTMEGLNALARFFFFVERILAYLMIVVFYVSFNLNLVDLFGSQVSVIQQALNDSIFQPLFLMGCAAAFCVLIGRMVRQDLAGALGQIVKVIAIVMLSILVVTMSDTMLSMGNNITKEISLEILVGVNSANGYSDNINAFSGEAAGILWNNMVHQKMYVTGGIGATHIGEAFSFNYDLPNDTAYAETCASIGLVFFARCMLEIQAKAEYADVMELALYNGVLSGMALDGKSFFYVNPLEVLPEACHKDERKFHVKPIRQKWFGCACCPPNLARTVSSVASYAYTENDTTLFVHLYMGGTVEGEKVKASITSEFPWDGHVFVTCESDTKEPYTFAFRIPGWCASYEKEIPKGAEVEEKDGYLYVTKVWAKGETIRLNFPMEIQLLASNPLVREDAGRVAVKRGPVVYCMEEADNGKNLHLTKLCVNGEKTAEAADELGEHFVCVTAEGRRMKLGDAEKQPLYHLYQKEEEEKTKLKLIPYYMWNNRGEGEMQVWIRACE